MVNKKNFLFFLCGVFVLFSYNILVEKTSFNTEDVFSAQKIFGIKFSKKEIDTLTPYLKRNLDAYKKMREFSLDMSVEPINDFEIKFIPSVLNNKETRFVLEKTNLPKQKKDIAYLPIYKLAYLIKNKLLSSEELTRIYLNRLKKYDKNLKAIITLTENLAIKQAKKADEEIAKGKYRGPLHGIPYGIKDLAAHPDFPTTWGAAPYKNQHINKKATVIKKLEDAGAVMLVKLSSGALARGDVWYGGKTKNPWNLNEGSSGSSAGSASATAAGLVGFSIGTETWGSIISPSTKCGVLGLRPTYGLISRFGFMSLSWSMDKVGPICRSAKGCVLVLKQIKGKDGLDQSVENAPLLFEDVGSLKKYKIGYLKRLFEKDTTNNGVNNTETLKLIKKLGGTLIPVSLPTNYPFDVFDIILRSEAGAFFNELIIERKDSILTEQSKRSRANSLRQSRFIPAVEYIQANRFRARLIEDVTSVFETFDIIISPTFGGHQMLTTNLTGHPALSIPNGFDKDNSPTSITIIGNYFEEGKLLSVAHLLQKESNYHNRKPPRFY